VRQHLLLLVLIIIIINVSYYHRWFASACMLTYSVVA